MHVDDTYNFLQLGNYDGRTDGEGGAGRAR
jgi:hypothetical protein